MHKQTLVKPEDTKRVISLADGRRLSLSSPVVMGIVNVTPDSFYDGGRYDQVETARERALEIVGQGAMIVDVGGESSRPGSSPVSLEEERQRVIPVVRAIREATDAVISVDTCRSEIACEAIEAGADIINDISALRNDSAMASLLAASQAPVVLMHMKGTPEDMQADPHYHDCVTEICEFFEERLRFCETHGIDTDRVILDPGIGFGKRLSDNLEILSGVDRFKKFGCPLLIGASRKSFMGMISDKMSQPEDRLGGSIAAAVLAVRSGADIVRVHDVKETVQALALLRAAGETE